MFIILSEATGAGQVEESRGLFAVRCEARNLIATVQAGPWRLFGNLKHGVHHGVRRLLANELSNGCVFVAGRQPTTWGVVWIVEVWPLLARSGGVAQEPC